MDYYKILGVEKSATQEEIKKAYHKLAHKYHPDKSGGDEKKFKEVNEAYQVLSNTEKRKQYDAFGRVGADQFAGGGGPFNWGDMNFGRAEDIGDLKDIFDMFFEGFGGAGARRRTYRRGGDLELNITLTLEEVKSGKKVKTTFNTFTACEKCSGIGHNPDKGFAKCARCAGKGEVKEERSTFFGKFAQVAVCAACRGSGEIPNEECLRCGGSGRTKGVRNVEFEVRPGVEDGQIIKISKLGEAGEHKTESGDLYIRVHVKPHSTFTRHGIDLYTKMQVSLVDILLKRDLSINNIDGKQVKFKIPSGFTVGEELRIKGEGLTERGDLVIKLDASAPKHLSVKAKKLLEDLDQEL
ncbi:MAG: DnaJ domain-containing protein [Candidatus Colwellbacteria bacterium]|nr:DnaJ domain-containing protein [Candidatus Colwellbacteria bacterium]